MARARAPDGVVKIEIEKALHAQIDAHTTSDAVDSVEEGTGH